MGRRELLVLGCVACLFAGCDDSDSSSTAACDVKTYKATCVNGNLRSCVDGAIRENQCAYGCENDACRSSAPSCDGNDKKRCDNKQPQVCVDGTWQNNGAACEGDCVDGVCQIVVEGECAPNGKKQCNGKQPLVCADGVWKNAGAACEGDCVDGECKGGEVGKCDLNGKKQCDGKQPQVCVNGSWQNEGAVCENECFEGQCKAAACGSGAPVCDKTDFGGKTCKNYVDYSSSELVIGELKCNDDCTINSDGCKKTTCGNGHLDGGEFCDIVKDKNGNDVMAYFANKDLDCTALNAKNCGADGQPSCYEYEEGGFPGCSADCQAMTRGTCRVKAQPMDGIQSCEFKDLNYNAETKEITVKGLVTPDQGLGQTNITGDFACSINATLPTYSWNIGRGALRHTDCADCAEGEFALLGDANLTSLFGGTYSCVFRVHVDKGQASTSLYLCPTAKGAPLPNDRAPSDDYVRTFQVEGPQIEGTILAQWNFNALVKDDNKTYDKFDAERGVAASSATLWAADGSKLSILSGTGGYGEGAAAMKGLPEETAFSCEIAKHFAIKVDTTGYENIKIFFNAMSSGTDEKPVAVAHKTADSCSKLGEFNTPTKDTGFVASPVFAAPNANNQKDVEFGIYTWNTGGSYDANQTLRIDDIYITGTPIATPAQ